MADSIYVDPTWLDHLSGQLGSIARELSAVRGSVHEVTAIVQNSDIAAAMGEFDGSWRSHRQHLVTSLTDGQHLATSAAKAYRSLDGGLRDSLIDGPPAAGGAGGSW